MHKLVIVREYKHVIVSFVHFSGGVGVRPNILAWLQSMVRQREVLLARCVLE